MKIIPVLMLTIVFLGCGGYGSPMAATPQPGVVPAIAALSPDHTGAGGPDFSLTVNGSSFATAAVVKWNGTSQTTMFVTGNQLIASIPAAAIASAGTVPVTVTNPGTPASGGPYGSGGTKSETSNPVNFTVQ